MIGCKIRHCLPNYKLIMNIDSDKERQLEWEGTEIRGEEGREKDKNKKRNTINQTYITIIRPVLVSLFLPLSQSKPLYILPSSKAIHSAHF